MNKRGVCYAFFLVIHEYDNCCTVEYCLDINNRVRALQKLLAEAFQLPLEMVKDLTANSASPPLNTMSFCDIIERFEHASKHLRQTN